MGYTHYWRNITPATDTQWNEFVETCKKLYNNLPEKSTSARGGYDEKIVICGGMGEGAPEFTSENVCFNGNDKDEQGNTVDLGHETFHISKNETSDFNFCKTARKPYDLLVCACLIAAGKFLGYKISTDGDVQDWLPAFEFYEDVVNATHNDMVTVDGIKGFLGKSN